jgi:hypothetical protein
MNKIENSVSLNSDVIRPYVGIEDFAGLLSEIDFFLSSRNTWTDEDTIVLNKVEYERLSGKIRIDFSSSSTVNKIRKACKAASLDLEQVELSVRLRCLATKRSEVLLKQKLNLLLGGVTEFAIFPSVNLPILVNREMHVEIYLTLNTDIKNNFPHPYLKATWLDQKTFQLRTKKDDTFGFMWNPMSMEDRVRMNLHKESLVHVVHQLSLIECDNIQDSVEVWVDESYLNALKTLPSKRLSRLLQRILVKDVLSGALKNTFDKMKVDNGGSITPWVEIEGRPVVKQVFGALEKRAFVFEKKDSAEEIYIDMFEHSDRISEFVEDLLNLRKASEYLQGGVEVDA